MDFEITTSSSSELVSEIAEEVMITGQKRKTIISEKQQAKKALRNKRKKMSKRIRLKNENTTAGKWISGTLNIVKTVGLSVLKPFWAPKPTEPSLIQLKKQVRAMKKQIREMQTSTTSSSSANFNSDQDIPIAPSVIDSIPMAPPVGAIPPPPPVFDGPMPAPSFSSSSLQSSSTSKIAPKGFSLGDITKVKLRSVDPSSVDSKESKQTPGLVISREQLNSVKLRKSSVDRPSMPAIKEKESGIDFAEMAALKLKKVDINRSPGGTPMKAKPKFSAHMTPTSQFATLRKKLQMMESTRDAENAECEQF